MLKCIRKGLAFSALVATVVTLVVVVVSGSARAQDDYPAKWKDRPLGHTYDDWGMATRYCTSWVAWTLSSRNDYSIPWHADAKDWGARATNGSVTVNTTPAVGSVAWWDFNHGGGYGHVAYVESISADGTKVNISEYNYDLQGNYHTREIAKTAPTGYIHFKDIGSSGGGGSSPPPASVNQRLVGDVNGDGKADAVVMFGATGNAKVALSGGESFGYPGDWSWGHSQNASFYLLGDVTGDSKADLVAYYSTLRKWFVSVSSGGGFWPPSEWSYDEPNFGGFDRAFIADVTGDGLGDKVVWFKASGNWFVSASNGAGFWPLQGWIGGNGVGSSNQEVADFNGDGKSDAAVYNATNGKWYVALSTGHSFGYPGEWSGGHGLGTSARLAGDVTGDGKADLAYYSNNIYKWWVGASSGSGFWGLSEWSYDGPGYNTSDQRFIADADGDGKADKIIWFRSSGNWHVARSSGGGFWQNNLWISGHGAGS